MKKLFPILAILLLACGKMTGQQTLGLFLNTPESQNGYTLFSNSNTTYLIDNCGEVVHTWSSAFDTNTSLYLLENGDLLRSCRIPGAFNVGGAAGRTELYNWEGDLLWAYEYASNDYHQHHDIAPLPNGNVLLLAWETRTKGEAIQAGRDPDQVTLTGLWPEKIVEVKMIGTDEAEIVWEWHMWDHLVQDFDPSKDNYATVADHPELFDVNLGANSGDWVHVNAIAYNPVLDQIALSSRVASEIWVIDHSTTTAQAAGHTGGNHGMGGDFLYRWGNPQNYDRGTAADQTLYGQHNITWIPEGQPGAGKMMVFNNGNNRYPDGADYSSVDIWQPPVDAAGDYFIENNLPYGPTEADWTYSAPGFFSSNISGAHSLPNGNVFVCEGRDGRFFEVTPGGETVWEYVNPVIGNQPASQGQQPNGNDTFRATRYPADYPAFEGHDLTPQGPIELNPLPSDCVIFDTASPSREVAVLQGVWLRQNPVGEVLQVENLTDSEVSVEVWDLAGRQVFGQMTVGSQISVDASQWPSGFYVLRVWNAERTAFFPQKFVKK